tara:strand:+ start:776 stop:1177 length:402 start_codon:yes stop_codon:yes gene_type:complete
MSYVKIAANDAGGVIFSAENIANIRLYDTVPPSGAPDLRGIHVYYSNTAAFYSSTDTNGDADHMNIMVLIIKPVTGSFEGPTQANGSVGDAALVKQAVLESFKTSNTPVIKLSAFASAANTRYRTINLTKLLA